MNRKILGAAVALGALVAGAGQAVAVTELQWWHAMSGANNEVVDTLAKEFNESQDAYKITPVFKGTYPETLNAGIAGGADVILIPGSKATLSDLAALRAEGWDIDILAHHRRGGLVVGLCGGYQMLGRTLADPDGIEGAAVTMPGLGLLEVDTVIGAAKTLRPAAGRDTVFDQAITGYEMHMGVTTGPGLARPWLSLADGADGAVSADGRVMGAYVHGLFAADDFRAAFLGAVRAGDYAAASHAARVEETLDALAKHLETHLDMDGLDAAFA